MAGDEIPGVCPRLACPLRGRDGGRAVPERGVPRGGGPHVAVADAALRPPALRAGAAQPGLHPPRRQPRPPAGAAAAPPAAGAPRQVGESRPVPPPPHLRRWRARGRPRGSQGALGAPRPLCRAGATAPGRLLELVLLCTGVGRDRILPVLFLKLQEE